MAYQTQHGTKHLIAPKAEHLLSNIYIMNVITSGSVAEDKNLEVILLPSLSLNFLSKDITLQNILNTTTSHHPPAATLSQVTTTSHLDYYYITIVHL